MEKNLHLIQNISLRDKTSGEKLSLTFTEDVIFGLKNLPSENFRGMGNAYVFEKVESGQSDIF